MLRTRKLREREYEFIFVDKCAGTNGKHRKHALRFRGIHCKNITVYLFICYNLLLFRKSVKSNKLITNSRRTLKLQHFSCTFHINT